MDTTVDRAELARRLEEEIAATEARLSALEEALQPRESDCGIGRMLNPENIPGNAAAEEELKIARARLRKLEAARTHLQDPDFGLCQVCGSHIPAERLLIVPEARTCAGCK